MTPRVYSYLGALVRVVDGDTLYLRVRAPIDFGFRRALELSSVEEFRLSGIDTPERHAPTRAAGERAAAALESCLTWSSGGVIEELEVTSLAEDDKYGRWLAQIAVDGKDVADWLICEGYARRYDGRGPRLPWDPGAPYPLPPQERAR